MGDFKLFTLEFAFTAACLTFKRQALTLLNHDFQDQTVYWVSLKIHFFAKR
ncbi:MAG: hypothetical protein LBP59_14525 [Planctomycetaceae bacterium]|nr:hypothetical protein [Planctomycetaceae bacterium]